LRRRTRVAYGRDIVRFESATELAWLIRSREVSAVEVVEAHLARIDEVNPALNAVVQLAAGRARAEAAAADRLLGHGTLLGPLHGVPFTAKDNIETAEIVTAVGVVERAATVPLTDATVVARLRQAGAILLGKTNCPEWGGGNETDNTVYGRTSNPYDATRTPGGSSGGECAIIAAGGSPLGLGSDSGGSLRLPAAWCGVATIKPTATLVPLTGVLDDRGPLGAMRDPRTQIGPIARSVADLALGLGLIAGPDRHDAAVPRVELGDPNAVQLRGLRIGFFTTNGIRAPTRETVAAATAAAAALADAGAPVTEALPPPEGDITGRVWRSYDGEMTADDLYDALRDWDRYRSRMLEFIEPFDLLVCPAVPYPAVPHGGTSAIARDEAVSYTTPFSLTGWPCVVVRCGWAAPRLPIGVQLVARPWHDHVALAAGEELERVFGRWERPPL
jgi:amidase